MAAAPAEEPDSALEEQNTSKGKLKDVHERAMRNFEISVTPQLEQRSLCLIARRFVNIPGAMWEGDFGECFPDEIKMEIPLIKEGIDKIKRDYNEHRIVPDFRPAGDKGNDDSAENLNGMYRADANCYGSDEAWDIAFGEGVDGGFGAYRLTNEYADPYDKDSDKQRINPGYAIPDADQRVFFGPSDRYDKSDAPYAFVITAHARALWEDEHPDATVDWPVERLDPVYDWYAPDVVKTAEYYEVEEVTEKLFVLTHSLSQIEERYWDSEIDDDELADLKKMGWKVKVQNRRRKRVHKYQLSGAEVLADLGLIAGDRIPVAPFYGKRTFVDGIERYEGYTQSKMDVQRAYNIAFSRIMETSTQAPRNIPIFLSSQVPPHIADMWARQIVDRHAYAVVEPVIDPQSGQMIPSGPIGEVPAPQVDPNAAAVLQIARTDLTENQQDGADEVKANTSADALEVAAQRVDAKSGIYLDNWRKTTKAGGEIYLCMASDVYYEPGRDVETQDEEGNEGTATLVKQYTDQRGSSGYLNDFTNGHYKCVVKVTEATATRRDKTVKACLNMAEMFMQLDPELAKAAGITAVANMDGEGMSDLQKFARKRALLAGLAEPTDEEKAEMQQEAQNQQPDPNAELAAAKTADLAASAKQRQADTMLKVAQATAIGGPEQAPAVPDGLEAAHKAADITKKVAEADHIRTQTAHLPEQLAIERSNAEANRVKAEGSKLSAFKNLFQSKS
jgi:hypothetical protein